jgi:hypothetical protein
MTGTLRASVLLAALMLATASFAQAPADAPAGTTGLCKDGSYWSGATKKGACSHHQGVQTWYGVAAGGSSSGAAPAAAAPAPKAAAAPAPAPAAAPPPAAAPAAPAAAPKAPTAPAKSSSTTPPADAAPGGGPGLVWVNSSSKVYHCPSDRWYGKTKNGAYMSEAQAKAQGNRPDHGKACQ